MTLYVGYKEKSSQIQLTLYAGCFGTARRQNMRLRKIRDRNILPSLVELHGF